MAVLLSHAAGQVGDYMGPSLTMASRQARQPDLVDTFCLASPSDLEGVAGYLEDGLCFLGLPVQSYCPMSRFCTEGIFL